MSDPLESLRLKLPYLVGAQAQKHVTHNEALRRLDNLVQLAVINSSLSAPPATPAEGDRYVVASGGSGAWAGHGGDIVSIVDGAWQFDTPEEGWLAFDLAAGVLIVHQASGWAAVSGVPAMVDHFGVNATADETNRLVVKSEAVLFSGIDAADGGSGDIRFIVNKEADGDAASLLFQSGWSGRAEVGLCGDADFVFKVSPDGSTWIEAIRVDKDTGLPTLLYDNGVSGLSATTMQDAIDEVAAGGGGGGGTVASVFGRTGTVAATASDYDASQVDNDSGVGGATVKDALNALAGAVTGRQSADDDLTALAAVSATGLLARTGAGTAAARTLTGGTNVQVVNGDGVSAAPAIDCKATTRNRQTASYTLVLNDAGKLVEMNVAAPNTLTVPPESSVAWPADTFINLAQYGAGQTTVAAGAGVTIHGRSGLKLGGQYAGATLEKCGTDEWYLWGDLTA